MANLRCTRRPATTSPARTTASTPTNRTTTNRARRPKPTTSSEQNTNPVVPIASTSQYPKASAFSFTPMTQPGGPSMAFLCRSMQVSQWFLLELRDSQSQWRVLERSQGVDQCAKRRT